MENNTRCTVCGHANPRHSLPIKREKGKWVAKPVCTECRNGLYREARALGKTIRFYGLDSSLAEADRRNAEVSRFQPFLDAFAKAKEEKPRTAVVNSRIGFL